MLKTLLKPTVALLAIAISSVVALGAERYSDEKFREAQKAGKPILIDVSAPWCPTCRVQRPIIESIQKARPDLVVYEVDFDRSKDTLRRFGVQYQSTLIVFKGTNELDRSTGETDPSRIRAMVAKSL